MRTVTVQLSRRRHHRPHRPPPVRRLRRASRAAASMAAFSSRAIPTPTRRVSARTCWRWCASWRRPSCAIPAAISSPAITGRTASARSSSGRAGSIWPGCRPRPNQFGTNEFIDWCRAAEHRADAGGQPRHARRRRGAQPGGILQPSRRHGAVRPAPRARLGAAARRQVLVPRQRDGRPVADGGQDRHRIRPHRHRSRQDDEADRRPHRTRRLRLVRPQHADLRRVGRHSAGAYASTMSSTSRCTPT